MQDKHLVHYSNLEVINIYV